MTFINEFSWSAKKDKTFNTCKRKYYYDCYGSFKGWFSDSAETVRELWLLKNLWSIPLWTGILVRDSIRKIVTDLYCGKEPNLERSLEELDQAFKNQFLQSESKVYKTNPKKHLALREHEYGLIIDEDGLSEKLDFAKSCVRNFYESDLLQEIKGAGRENWVIRRQDDFPQFYFDGTKVYCMYDLAILKDGILTVYDWTTGAMDDSDEDFDVRNNVLLLYFSKKENLSYDKIFVKKIFLRNNHIETTTFPLTGIQKIKDYVIGSKTKMELLLDDKELNTAAEEKFEKTDNQSHCTFCNYKRYCFPGAVSEFRGY